VEEALPGVAEISRIPGVGDSLRSLVLEESLVQRKFRLDFPFFDPENLLASPHNINLSEGILTVAAGIAERNIKAFLEGEAQRSVADREDYLFQQNPDRFKGVTFNLPKFPPCRRPRRGNQGSWRRGGRFCGAGLF